MDFTEVETYTDTTAWGIGLIVYLIVVFIMWKGWGAENWQTLPRIFVTILGLPVCYLTAKLMIDKGG